MAACAVAIVPAGMAAGLVSAWECVGSRAAAGRRRAEAAAVATSSLGGRCANPGPQPAARSRAHHRRLSFPVPSGHAAPPTICATLGVWAGGAATRQPPAPCSPLRRHQQRTCAQSLRKLTDARTTASCANMACGPRHCCRETVTLCLPCIFALLPGSVNAQSRCPRGNAPSAESKKTSVSSTPGAKRSLMNHC